jgi:hypothetical protein
MKSFEIFDEENSRSVGVLLYFEKEKNFIIELSRDLDEWSAPLLFAGFVKKDIYTIPRGASLLWVKERIIPSGRQNIGSILKKHKLKAYDEFTFLELSGGRCSQDSLCIKKIDTVPAFVEDRMKTNLTGMFVSGDSLICFFADDTAKRVELKNLEDVKGVDKIRANKELLSSGHIGSGGYYVTFNESIDLPAATVYARGTELNVKKEDFLAFVGASLLDTTETCDILSCTRQNLAYMVKQESLVPVKENVKGNLYFRDDVHKSRW